MADVVVAQAPITTHFRCEGGHSSVNPLVDEALDVIHDGKVEEFVEISVCVSEDASLFISKKRKIGKYYSHSNHLRTTRIPQIMRHLNQKCK